MSEKDDEIFHAGLLRNIAKAIGWDKLRALVERLAAEDAAKGRNP